MDIVSIISRQGQFFQTGATRLLDFRVEQLRRLQAAIESRESEILDALYTDLRKSAQEAYTTEVGFVFSDIRHAIKRLPAWMTPQRRRLPLIALPGRAVVHPEPFGVALIIGPWNYPFQLLFSPLVGAIAAGNCAVLKPSEFAPHTSTIVVKLIADIFPVEYITVVEGDHTVAESLLKERFDKIFFTGSTAIGRAVMAAAAQHLTPVTLELGGKSPAIVCNDASPDITARRIVWGKFMNTGQTCVAPDFILVDRQIRQPLVSALSQAIREFYGEDPQQSPDYGRIINQKHFDRLTRLVANLDAQNLYIPPTILTDASWDSPVMQEEIFGPILPVLEFDILEEVIAKLRDRPTPLALYLFTNNPIIQQQVITNIRSGGVCINDTLMHLTGKDLPFGGLGDSGLGAYHGKVSFDCFSHYRSVMWRSTLFDFRLRYPPPKLPLVRLRKLWRWLYR